MLDLETRLNLESDVTEVHRLLKEHGGDLASDEQPGLYWLTVRPARSPADEYYVRVLWTAYPHEPPSIKFADAVGGSLAATNAWPVIPGYRPSSADICKPFTAEGFALHPEWMQGPEAWTITGNRFLWVVCVLQDDLDNSYSGRSA
jgi:hypothetical protein